MPCLFSISLHQENSALLNCIKLQADAELTAVLF